MTMIGFHLIPASWSGEDTERVKRLHPRFVKIVCVDEKPPVADEMPASASLVIRNHPLSEGYGQRGWGTLREATKAGYEDANACRRMADYLNGLGIADERLLFEGRNEPEVWTDGESPKKVDAYYKAFVARLHEHGLHGVILNLGVGWPGNGGVTDAPPDWAPFANCIGAMQPGDYVGAHEYWAFSGPQENWGWWAGRSLTMPYRVPILITECGIDGGVVGRAYAGWQDLPEPSTVAKANRYVRELVWYAGTLAADARVQGVLPFTYGTGSEHWLRFDLRGGEFWNVLQGYYDLYGFPAAQSFGWLTAAPAAEASLEQVRHVAWNTLGVPYNPDAAFVRHARANGLGHPVTPEIDVDGWRMQGYVGGILYAQVGRWDDIRVLSW